MKINKGYLAEINLPSIAIGQRYTFLDIPELRYNKVVSEGLEAFVDTTLSLSPNKAPVILAAGAAGLVLTIVVGENEEIYEIPVSTLVSSINSGLIRELADKRINITKSYVTILNNTGLTAGQSAMFYFYYRPSIQR